MPPACLVGEARDLHMRSIAHDVLSTTERASERFNRWTRGVCDTVAYLCILCPLCAYWVLVQIAEGWLKFRAALSDRRARLRVCPKVEPRSMTQLYLDLELKIKQSGAYGGQRAVFITKLARVEDELVRLQDAEREKLQTDAAKRREEESRLVIRRREAIAETKRKLGMQDGDS